MFLAQIILAAICLIKFADDSAVRHFAGEEKQCDMSCRNFLEEKKAAAAAAAQSAAAAEAKLAAARATKRAADGDGAGGPIGKRPKQEQLMKKVPKSAGAAPGGLGEGVQAVGYLTREQVGAEAAGYLTPQLYAQPGADWSVKEKVQQAIGRFDQAGCDAIHISVAAGFELPDTESEELCDSLGAMQGIYWLVGREESGMPYYRQEPQVVGEPNCHELFLWFFDHPTEGGWFIKGECWGGDVVMPPASTKVCAWLGNSSDLPLSGSTLGDDAPVHVPYWCSKKAKLAHGEVLVQPLHDYQFCKEVEQTQEIACLQSEMKQQQDEIEQLKADLAEASAWHGPREEEKAQAAKNSGGWAPKVSEMVTAIHRKNWQHVEGMAQKWYTTNATVKLLVDQALWQLSDDGRGTSQRRRSIADNLKDAK